MIDLTLRMDYADVFDFYKFHEVFRQQLADAKGGERFTLQAYIEEHHELWRDYDVTKTAYIATILETEVSDTYGIFPDPEDYISLSKPQRIEGTRRKG